VRARLLLTIVFVVAPSATALAEADPFHAGISRLTVIASAPFDALVWYPTDAEETSWDTSGFRIPATSDAPIAPGPFAIVLLSHGGGQGGGNPLILRDLSSVLARQGFVVIAPFHGPSRLPQRPFQIREALDEVTAEPRFKPHVDPARLGMIGFSLGTAVTLMLAGATPDFAHLDAYCDGHPTDMMSCNDAPGGGGRRTSAPPAGVQIPLPPPLPLQAIVLLDPYGALFSRDHLTAVTMPVLQFRPDHSQLGEENSAGPAASLPRRPRVETIPGTHFIFADTCPPRLQAAAPEACKDPPGVDRAAVHAAVEAQVVRFLKDNM